MRRRLGRRFFPAGVIFFSSRAPRPAPAARSGATRCRSRASGHGLPGHSEAARVWRKVVHRVPRREWARRQQLVGAAGSCEQLSGCAWLLVSPAYGRPSAEHSALSCSCPRTRLKPLCARSRATAIQRATWLVSSCQRQTRPMVPLAFPITFSM